MRHCHRARFALSAVVVSQAVVWALLGGSVSVAAPDAGAKARGDFNFYAHSAHNSFSHARSHVETYQRYLHETHGVALPAPAAGSAVQSAPLDDHAAQIAAHGEVDSLVAREASDVIADDIERIQRHVDRMQVQAQARGDAAALAKLTDVEKQLGIARRAHASLHEHHAGEAIAPATAMELAQKVNGALRAAHAAHDEVAGRLDAAGQP